MIELFFLLIFIPRRVRALARERGESALKWTLAAIGAWIGAELLVGLLFGVAWGVLAGLGILPPEVPPLVLILSYILFIGAAGLGATFVIQRLRKKPVITTS